MRTHRKAVGCLLVLAVCLRDGALWVEEATIRRGVAIEGRDEGLHRVKVLTRRLESACGAPTFGSHAALAAGRLRLDLGDPPMLIVLS